MSDDLRRNYSVLLVDDDRFLLDMYAMKFSSCGCAVKAISNPQEALDYLRKGGNEPDMILLDVMMPGLSGFDFLETLRTEHLAPNATIIMLTNQGQDQDREKATSLGADGYIIKASAVPSEVLQQAITIVDSRKKK